MKRFRLQVLPVPESVLEELLENPNNLSKEDLAVAVETLKQQGVFSFRKVLRDIVRVPMNQQTGATLEEIEKSLPLFEALRKTIDGDVLELEDETWRFLCEKLESVRVTRIDERWITLRHVVKNATADVLDGQPNVTQIKRKKTNGA
jgi:hypothetical protein